mmetsp:Transcript_12127/g.17486  ORF Transcript_12127/g.17486 Transcript_12127/m.17486 type:complete len:299 (+) Transcript_12127:55-951(+)
MSVSEEEEIARLKELIANLQANHEATVRALQEDLAVTEETIIKLNIENEELVEELRILDHECEEVSEHLQQSLDRNITLGIEMSQVIKERDDLAAELRKMQNEKETTEAVVYKTNIQSEATAGVSNRCDISIESSTSKQGDTEETNTWNASSQLMTKRNGSQLTLDTFLSSDRSSRSAPNMSKDPSCTSFSTSNSQSNGGLFPSQNSIRHVRSTENLTFPRVSANHNDLRDHLVFAPANSNKVENKNDIVSNKDGKSSVGVTDRIKGFLTRSSSFHNQKSGNLLVTFGNRRASGGHGH